MSKQITINVTDEEYDQIKNNIEKIFNKSLEETLKIYGLCEPELYIEHEEIAGIHIPKSQHIQLNMTMAKYGQPKTEFLKRNFQILLKPEIFLQFKKEFKEKYNEDYVYTADTVKENI